MSPLGFTNPMYLTNSFLIRIYNLPLLKIPIELVFHHLYLFFSLILEPYFSIWAVNYFSSPYNCFLLKFRYFIRKHLLPLSRIGKYHSFTGLNLVFSLYQHPMLIFRFRLNNSCVKDVWKTRYRWIKIRITCEERRSDPWWKVCVLFCNT